MTTMSTEVNIYLTDRRHRRQINSFRGTYGDINFETGVVSLIAGQTKTIVFTKVFIAHFSKPTLIQLMKDLVIMNMQVVGPVIFPFNGSVTIGYPLDATTTDPLTFSYQSA